MPQSRFDFPPNHPFLARNRLVLGRDCQASALSCSLCRRLSSSTKWGKSRLKATVSSSSYRRRRSKCSGDAAAQAARAKGTAAKSMWAAAVSTANRSTGRTPCRQSTTSLLRTKRRDKS
eukprot:4278535-Pleurochrysis_carterae.AAC.1